MKIELSLNNLGERRLNHYWNIKEDGMHEELRFHLACLIKANL
jgi:hypothetical protein